MTLGPQPKRKAGETGRPPREPVARGLVLPSWCWRADRSIRSDASSLRAARKGQPEQGARAAHFKAFSWHDGRTHLGRKRTWTRFYVPLHHSARDRIVDRLREPLEADPKAEPIFVAEKTADVQESAFVHTALRWPGIQLHGIHRHG